MTVYTVNTKNFDADEDIRNEAEEAAYIIQYPYIQAGFVEKKPADWGIELDPGQIEPSNGVHSCRKPWTNQQAAEEFCKLINQWLDQNPKYKVYNYGPRVLVTD